MATTLYHASPSVNRVSILAHGLDLSRSRRNFERDGDPAPVEDAEAERRYPKGHYLSDSLEAAKEHGRWHFDVSDVWCVDVSGLHLALDRDHDGNPSGRSPYGGTAFFTYDDVPSGRLHLVEADVGGVWATVEG